MSYGLRVWDAGGGLTFDSETAGFGCLVDVVSVTSTSSFSVTYPDFAGKTCTVIQLAGWWNSDPVVDYSLGYPRMTVPAGYSGQVFTYGVFMT